MLRRSPSRFSLASAATIPSFKATSGQLFAAADCFLHLNGYVLAVEDSPGLADLIVDVLSGAAAERILIGLLSDGIRED